MVFMATKKGKSPKFTRKIRFQNLWPPRRTRKPSAGVSDCYKPTKYQYFLLPMFYGGRRRKRAAETRETGWIIKRGGIIPFWRSFLQFFQKMANITSLLCPIIYFRPLKLEKTSKKTHLQGEIGRKLSLALKTGRIIEGCQIIACWRPFIRFKPKNSKF